MTEEIMVDVLRNVTRKEIHLHVLVMMDLNYQQIKWLVLKVCNTSFCSYLYNYHLTDIADFVVVDMWNFICVGSIINLIMYTYTSVCCCCYCCSLLWLFLLLLLLLLLLLFLLLLSLVLVLVLLLLLLLLLLFLNFFFMQITPYKASEATVV